RWPRHTRTPGRRPGPAWSRPRRSPRGSSRGCGRPARAAASRPGPTRPGPLPRRDRRSTPRRGRPGVRSDRRRAARRCCLRRRRRRARRSGPGQPPSPRRRRAAAARGERAGPAGARPAPLRVRRCGCCGRGRSCADHQSDPQHGHAVDRTGDRHMSAPDHSTRTAGRAAGPAAPRQAPPARPSPLLLGAAAVTVAVLALIAVLAADAAGGSNVVLRDAGLIARRGAPVSALIADLAVAVALGGSVLAGWLLREPGDRTRAMTLVAIAAAVTTLARGASLAFSYAVATGQAVGSERFGSDLNVFLGTDLGIWLVLALVVSATATTIAVTGSSVTVARIVAVAIAMVGFA